MCICDDEGSLIAERTIAFHYDVSFVGCLLATPVAVPVYGGLEVVSTGIIAGSVDPVVLRVFAHRGG